MQKTLIALAACAALTGVEGSSGKMSSEVRKLEPGSGGLDQLPAPPKRLCEGGPANSPTWCSCRKALSRETALRANPRPPARVFCALGWKRGGPVSRSPAIGF
jgi:hypothetical protein